MANAMGDRYGINVGNILGTAKALKAEDQNSEMRDMEMNAMKAETADKNAAQGFKQAFINAKTADEQRAAFNQLVSIDSKTAESFINGYDKMDERERAATKRQNNKFGQYAHVVSQAENPQKAWEEMKRYMTPEQKSEWGEYSPVRVDLHLTQAHETAQLMELNDKIGLKKMDQEFSKGEREEKQVHDKDLAFSKMDYDALSQEDRQKHDKEMLKLKSEYANSLERIKGGSKGGLKAADVNAMYKQAAALYGGFFDPNTGEFTGLDAEKAQKVQGLIRSAESNAAGGLGLAESVSRAAEAAGITIPGGVKQPVVTEESETVTTPAGTATETAVEVTEAPPAALEYLKANPGQAKLFKTKYGYLPPGY